MLRPKLNRIWTSSNSAMRRDPGDTKYIQGWIAEIPTYQVLNYLQYKADIAMLALAERGIFEWGTDVQYTLGSAAWDESNGVIYISTVGSPDRSLRPSANLSQWTPSAIQVSKVQYDTVVNAINTHIADITGNPHQLTAGRLNAYNKNEIDNIVAQYRALVAAHVNDRNNPHQLTAAGVGAVPAAGGTYTGDVIFNAGLYFDSGKVNQITRAGGLFLQANTAVLGIDASGKVVAGTTSSQSPVVTEGAFPNLKAARELDYTIPQEILKIPFMGDINVQTGRVNVDIPFGYFDSVYGCFAFTNGVGSNGGQGGNSLDDAGSIANITTPGITAITVAFDYLQKSGKNSDASAAVVFGLSRSYLILTTSGVVFAEYNDGGTTFVNTNYNVPQTNVWHRIVGVFDSTGVKLYLDGVRVGFANISANLAGGSALFQLYNKPQGQGSEWCVKGFRVWNTALTDKQVSTL